MTKWKYKIDFTNHVKKYQSEEYGVEEMCMKIHKQLRSFKLYEKDDDYTYIVDDLGDMVNDDGVIEIEDYDNWLNNLYDWADYIRCWIVPTF